MSDQSLFMKEGAAAVTAAAAERTELKIVGPLWVVFLSGTTCWG